MASPTTTRVRIGLLAAAAAAGLLNAPGAFAQGQVAKLTASDAQASDLFGNTAADGDIAVVGAAREETAGADAGAAYIFARNQGGPGNWGEVTKLLPNETTASDWFGHAVAISGDTVVVTARNHGDTFSGSGSAYVFQKDQGGFDNWGFVMKLVASDPSVNDLFGNSVAIDGDTVVVGAWFGDGPAIDDTGAAYVFERDQGGADNWGQVKKLNGSGTDASDSFGWSVDTRGDLIAVGAYSHDGGGTQQGAAYIFERDAGGADNWGEIKMLTAFDGSDFDFFARGIAIDGDILVAGADQDDDANPANINCSSGSAYVFAKDQGGVDNWGFVKKLINPNGSCGPPSGEFFGATVSISGTVIVASSVFDDDEGTNSGSAFLFERNEGGSDNWGLVARIHPGDVAENDTFGGAVSIMGDMIAASSFGDDDGGELSGSAYLFSTSVLLLASLDCNANNVSDLVELVNGAGADCNGNGHLDECDIADGTSLDDDADGVPDECTPACPADLDNDNTVGIVDFLALLANWGPCPP